MAPASEGPAPRATLVMGLVAAIETCSRLAGMVAAWLLAAIIALMLLEMVWRQVAARSLHYTWEYSAYAMAGVFLLGASYTLHTGAHVRVTALLETVPSRAGRWLDTACTFVGLGVVATLTSAMASLAYDSWLNGVVSFTVNQVPLAYPQFMMAFGLGLLTLQFAARLARLLVGAEPDVIPADEEIPDP